MRRMGIHESTIMKIGGWKTRSVFDRYNIVDQSDLADAARRMDERQEQLQRRQEEQPTLASKEAMPENRHSLGIVEPKDVQVVNVQLPN